MQNWHSVRFRLWLVVATIAMVLVVIAWPSASDISAQISPNPTPTSTPVKPPPTDTPTPVLPTATDTAVPPTATDTAVPPTPTDTVVPPTTTATPSGLIAGTGWIDSPVGAYVADPSFKGRAAFRLWAQYRQGDEAPGGFTAFRLLPGKLTFRSSAYEWLAIGQYQATYQGVGRINGGGDYGFLISAIDGALVPGGGPDRLRVRIWDRGNGDALVYDNQFACGDLGETSEPCNPIGGGNIQIIP